MSVDYYSMQIKCILMISFTPDQGIGVLDAEKTCYLILRQDFVIQGLKDFFFQGLIVNLFPYFVAFGDFQFPGFFEVPEYLIKVLSRCVDYYKFVLILSWHISKHFCSVYPKLEVGQN